MARKTRLAAVGLIGVPLVATGLWLMLPLVARGLVRTIELLMQACVWVAMSISVGVSVWTIMGTIGRTAASAVSTTEATVGLGGLAVVGAAAAYALQRLLGSEEESSR